MKNKAGETVDIRVEENVVFYADEKRNYTGYYIFAYDENICELTYEELLLIRDLIDRIERRHKQKEEKGGAQ